MFVAVVQLDIRWEQKQANFERVSALVDAAAPPAGALIVLPEMFATGFSMNVASIAEEPGGPTDAFLASLARRHRATVVGGVVTRAPDGRGLNQCVVMSPEGAQIARYTKLHPFSYAGEHQHYAPGDHVVTFSWSGFNVAPLICYDLRFPEAYRAAIARGATMLVTIANFPAKRTSHWVSLNVARAIENQAYVVACNRCGSDPQLSYDGQSMIIDPRGSVIAGGSTAEGVTLGEVLLEDVTAYRQGFPALGDVRADLAPPPPRAAS